MRSYRVYSLRFLRRRARARARARRAFSSYYDYAAVAAASRVAFLLSIITALQTDARTAIEDRYIYGIFINISANFVPYGLNRFVDLYIRMSFK